MWVLFHYGNVLSYVKRHLKLAPPPPTRSSVQNIPFFLRWTKVVNMLPENTSQSKTPNPKGHKSSNLVLLEKLKK